MYQQMVFTGKLQQTLEPQIQTGMEGTQVVVSTPNDSRFIMRSAVIKV